VQGNDKTDSNHRTRTLSERPHPSPGGSLELRFDFFQQVSFETFGYTDTIFFQQVSLAIADIRIMSSQMDQKDG
jgi:hypothetical protein